MLVWVSSLTKSKILIDNCYCCSLRIFFSLVLGCWQNWILSKLPSSTPIRIHGVSLQQEDSGKLNKMNNTKSEEILEIIFFVFSRNVENYRCIHESLTVEDNYLRPSAAPIYPREATRFQLPSKINFIRLRGSSVSSINRKIPTEMFIVEDVDKRLILDEKAIRFFRNIEGYPLDVGSKKATIQK